MAEINTVRWGILGTGSIGRRFASALPKSATGSLAAVGSRSLDSATAVTSEFGGTPYDSYDQVLADPMVQAVYIALPHHMHAEWTIKCAEAGKDVLCEKPFTLNQHEAVEALDVVRKCGVFFMEAFMYRCHPQTVELKRLVDSGEIGTPLLINAEFGFNAPYDWNNFRAVAEVGGGGLMDVGTYCVSMCRLIAGHEPERIEYTARIKNGYDASGTGILGFSSGLVAMIGCGIHCQLRNWVVIYGSEGRIEVPSPWMCGEGFRVFRNGTSEPETVCIGEDLDLYANEADVVAHHLESREAPHMTWQDTMNNSRTLDAMRRSAGFRFQGDAW